MYSITYICSICSLRKTINLRRIKKTIKLKCKNCNRKVKFRYSVNNENQKHDNLNDPINKTSSSGGVTFTGDFGIQENYSSLEGLNIKGNVSIANASGNWLTDMRILKRKDNNMTGNINVFGSNNINIKNTQVANDINIFESSHLNIDKTLVGLGAFDGERLAMALTILLNGRSEPDKVIESLKDLQDVLVKHGSELESLGINLKEANKTDNSVSIVLKHNLQKAGIYLMKKATDIGLGNVIQWLCQYIHSIL